MAKGNGGGPKKRKTGSFLYRSYNFVDKDPVIDRIRTIVADEGLSYGEIHIISGVSASTLTNWFDGETRRPQYATIAAVTYALGYKQEFVKAKKLDYEKEITKAKAEIEQAAKSKGK
jgi:transcriptional regulator with XRE-family HTH domain